MHSADAGDVRFVRGHIVDAAGTGNGEADIGIKLVEILQKGSQMPSGYAVRNRKTNTAFKQTVIFQNSVNGVSVLVNDRFNDAENFLAFPRELKRPCSLE